MFKIVHNASSFKVFCGPFDITQYCALATLDQETSWGRVYNKKLSLDIVDPELEIVYMPDEPIEGNIMELTNN